MGNLAITFGLQVLAMWGACAVATPIFLPWACRLRDKSLKKAENILVEEAENQPTSATDTSKSGFIVDWRLLQKERSDDPSSVLMQKFNQQQGEQLIWIILTGFLSMGIVHAYWPALLINSPLVNIPPLLSISFVSLCLLPWGGLIALCSWVQFPVIGKLAQVKWSKQEYRSFSLWDSAGVYSIWTSIMSALFLIPKIEPMLAVISLGFLSLLWCKGQAAKKVDEVPLPLLPGELRDRVIEIGQKSGLTIRNIQILPKMRSATANAFAHADGSVTLTDYLVAHSHRSELEAIIAHEIAHVKYNHARWLTMISLLQGGLALWIIANFKLIGLLIVVFWPMSAIYQRFSRRFEYAADALSGKLTGQPEKMIAGLARLELLNPVRQSGNKETTHPTMLKRFEAIAKTHNLSDETVRQQLLQAAEPIDPNEAYPIPLGTDDKIFPTSQKQKYQQRDLFLLLTASLVPLAAIATFSPYLPSPGLQTAMAVVGLLAVVGACYWSDRHSSFNLPKPVLQCLRQQLSQTTGPSAIVSLSPDGKPQSYGGSWFWDLGILSLEEGQLRYRGGQTEFCLSPDQVNNLRLAADVPSLVRTPNLYLTWNNAGKGNTEADSHGHLRLRFLDLNSSQAVRQVTRDWRDRLETWRQTPASQRSASQPGDAKTLNRDSFVTALATPRSYRRTLSNLFSLWLLGAVGALMLVGLLELPPERWFYIAAGPAVAAAYTLLCYLTVPQQLSSSV